MQHAGETDEIFKVGSVENRRRSNSQNLSRLCVWRCASLVAWLFLGGGFFSLKAATLPAGFTESQWGSTMPGAATAMAFAPDGRLFVCLQSGQVRVINKDGVLLANPFVTLSVDSNGERGLLGVAFDPNFASNHYVYLYYTVPGSPAHNRISRFTANGNVAAANSEFVLVNLDNLSNATNHNGGAIHFGPDGKLYVGVGENANGANAQSLSNRLGKILRINSNGTIPLDNPRSFPGIAGSTFGVNRAIWAVGLRNPFTFAFQPGTARLFINDVGASTWEEINDGVAGSNYGWPIAEGPASPPNPNFRDPIFYYGHGSSSTTGCAIVGGAFYNPSVLQFPRRFVGKYFFADLCTGWIRVLDPSNNAASNFASGIPGPVDLHVGPDGALYYLIRGGRVFRIQATPSQAPIAVPYDFNNDGHSDYALNNSATRQTAVWYMNNNVRIGNANGPTLLGGWSLASVADFNRDDHPDYLLLNTATRATWIWYMNNNARIGNAFGPTLPVGWRVVALGDFNRDGYPDYLLLNANTGGTLVWYMRNNVRNGAAPGPTLLAGLTVAGVADFNGDTHADYLLFNAATHQTVIWYMSGVTRIGSRYGPRIPAGFEVAGLADFDGNGRPDYLLYNSTTRHTAIWYLNNFQLIGSAAGPTIWSGWNIVAP